MNVLTLFLLALPVAWASWTVAKEEVFREWRDYCGGRCQNGGCLFTRKFFYLWTCEYCFSHYMAALFLVLTRYQLVYDDWRGYLVSFPALVCVANVYMSLYSRLRVEIHKEKAEAKLAEEAPQVALQLRSPAVDSLNNGVAYHAAHSRLTHDGSGQ